MRKILFLGIARDVNGIRRLGAIAFAGLLLAALAGTKALPRHQHHRARRQQPQW